jgi:thioredoxin-related protein
MSGAKRIHSSVSINSLINWYSVKYFLFFLFFFFSSCTSEKSKKETLSLDNNYAEYQLLNLTNHDIRAKLMIPDETADIGASLQREVFHEEGDFIWRITAGPNFYVEIEDWGDYKGIIANKKKELKKNKHFTVRFLIDDRNLIFYERTLVVKGNKNAPKSVGTPHTSFHVCGEYVLDGVTYELRTKPQGYRRNQRYYAEVVAKSIRSFKALK